MSVLRNLESKLAGLVEGTFSRAFKSEVRPVEIARKLAREMDQHKAVSLSRTYVPNEYTVWLSTRDRDQFSGDEGDLRAGLSAYLLEHARRGKLALVRRPATSERRAAAGGAGGEGWAPSRCAPPRREKLALVSRPEISFKTDERLRLGEFGIQARLVGPDDAGEGRAVRAEESHTQVYSS